MLIFLYNVAANLFRSTLAITPAIINGIMPIIIILAGITILFSSVGIRVRTGGIFNACISAIGYVCRTIISGIGWLLRHLITGIPIFYVGVRRTFTESGMSPGRANILAIIVTIVIVVIII